MKRVILAVVSTVAGLMMLLSFKTHSVATVATPPAAVSPTTVESDTTGGTTSGSATSGSVTNGAASGGAASGTGPTDTASTTTVTGNATQTRYGPVQVAITVTNGQIAGVNAVEYPTESPKDAQINAYAIPRLNEEALAAKSAKIDMISGATYTSTGYISSLQSALNKAGLA